MSERYRSGPDPEELNADCESEVRDDRVEWVYTPGVSDLGLPITPLSLGLGLPDFSHLADEDDCDDGEAQKGSDACENNPASQADNALGESWWGMWNHWDLSQLKRKE